MPAKPRKITVSKYADHPRLLLAGIWLDRSGFKPGDKVTITNPEPGQLIIQIAEPPDVSIEPNNEPPVLTSSNVAEPEAKFYRSLLFPNYTHFYDSNKRLAKRGPAKA